LTIFNDHIKQQFKEDYSMLSPTWDDDYISRRDWYCAINAQYGHASAISSFRDDSLEALYNEVRGDGTSNTPTLEEVFEGRADDVRHINAIETTINGKFVGAFVSDGICNVFVERPVDGGSGNDQSKVQWYQFPADKTTMERLVSEKVSSDEGNYRYSPSVGFTQYDIYDTDWTFKMLNRDFTGKTDIMDAYAIHCKDGDKELWYVPRLDAYIYGASDTNGILDMAYEQYGGRLYVLFNNDNNLYAYDDILSQKTFGGFVVLKKETASLKLVTFNSMCITDDNLSYDRLFLDYFDSNDKKYTDWNVVLYGHSGEKYNQETWSGRPGSGKDNYKQYNSIVFGDSLFNESQLRFHNISKNKDMYDILDVHEIDNCYFGLFKGESENNEDETTYTVFKSKEGGVVQRLPWKILEPHMYRTNDDLYSLYVVSNEPVGKETRHVVLREISVPDTDDYPNRVIDLERIFKSNQENSSEDLHVSQLIMDEFKLESNGSAFFALTNKGFYKVSYEDQFKQLSIDHMDGRDSDGSPIGFIDRLQDTLRNVVLQKHIDEKHDLEQSYYFGVLKSKINQFDDNFKVFDLVPTEFDQTQDIGVVPDSKVTDIDDVSDHREDSILASTDILWTDGMVAQSDTNPGIVTCAVSNPATTYDDESVFPKSQRNPSIEGTEFYDFIYDQDGNTLMDLYAIPFIYRINSNNTYDLYINVPTTRTKYLNRIAGTLQGNGTSQVLADDTRTRVNFLNEPMPNNLDDSTTRLRVFIDKKYISIGTVELVEISGNSIPTQIYRDVPNNGLYDSIALESRWNGEVVQINEPSKDINKVMLEFECYGTDSQSIHIQGKTLVNRALDENKYADFEDTVDETPQNMVVTFKPMGGYMEETTKTVSIGELIGELPEPSRLGYTFLGWFTDVGGDQPDGIQVSSDSFATQEMGVLYAHWDKIEDENGGT
jgi:uncharacterized repeat protein (TIGR02543 family)